MSAVPQGRAGRRWTLYRAKRILALFSSSHATMTASLRHVWAIFLVFFAQSAVLGSWIPRIPDVKDSLGMSSFVLGLCLLALSAGTLLAFFIAGSTIDRFGLRRVCQFSVPAWALLFILPGYVDTAEALFAVLVLCGLAVGHCEVAMNTMADAIEKNRPRRIMSRCHGFWSLGSLFGALAGTAFARAEIDVSVHFLTVMPVLAVLGIAAGTLLPRRRVLADLVGLASDTGEPNRVLFRLPRKSILLLCFMPLGVMCVEGAFIDWSAVFMREVHAASAVVIGVTYSFFSCVMALTRLFGDRIVEVYGDYSVTRISGAAATLGIAVFALSQTPVMAFFGAALAGLGVAIVYPLAMTAAAARPGETSDNVAAVALVAFTAFLLAPPLIGFIADQLGLRLALLLLTPIAAGTWFLAGEVRVVDKSN